MQLASPRMVWQPLEPSKVPAKQWSRCAQGSSQASCQHLSAAAIQFISATAAKGPAIRRASAVVQWAVFVLNA